MELQNYNFKFNQARECNFILSFKKFIYFKLKQNEKKIVNTSTKTVTFFYSLVRHLN